MAARHLQKLRGDDLLQQVTSEPETSESDEDTAGPANPFDLLDEAEQDNGDDAEVHAAVRHVNCSNDLCSDAAVRAVRSLSQLINNRMLQPPWRTAKPQKEP